MEQGAYKLPSASEAANLSGIGGAGVSSGAPGGRRNQLGSEIKNLMDEIDISNPGGAGGRQSGGGLRVSDVTSYAAPKNIKEARNVDNMYLQEIENKLGLLNNMMTINQN